MNIHYFSGEAWEEAYVKAKLPNEEITFHEGPLSAFPELTDADAEVLCTFIESRIGEAEMNRFPALKFIATRSTGYDHIDLAAAKAREVVVANVPFYGENTVAEFTFALLLALSRRIIDADERVRNGTFVPSGLRGFDLAGKTIGVVGTGHIGAHVIKMAKGFGMKILGFDVIKNDELSRSLNFTYSTLPELLAASDIITLHVPYNKDTHHLINKENISSIKRGAYLINTSRGAVVETQALVDALKSGILAGAGLDVLEEENKLSEKKLEISIENQYLIEHPRVIVTPHLAFNTQEAVERILDTTIENIKSFGAGVPENTVS
ncbi:MAG: NAD(P)-dependent oxidoreductase [Patescibacteria group bacterium]